LTRFLIFQEKIGFNDLFLMISWTLSTTNEKFRDLEISVIA